MATMNSMDFYRDPSLDGLIDSQPVAYRNGTHKRNGSQSRRVVSDGYSDFADRPPPVPDVPRDPPLSYKGPGAANHGTVQRSFSQRARTRPYADEAFANQAASDSVREHPPRQPPMSSSSAPKPVAPPQVETAPPAIRRQRLIQENIRSAAAEAATSPRDYIVQPPSATTSRSQPVEHYSSNVQPNTSRDVGNQTEDQARDWAPDRSPLQKLEVTLNDISKEEKRARVQEAEMLLREKSRSRKQTPKEPVAGPSQKSSTRRQVPSAEEAPRLEDAGLVRNLSSTQRDRLQHSTTIDSRKPDARRLSGEKRGFDYERNGLPPSDTVPTSRSRRESGGTSRQHIISGPARAVSNPQTRPNEIQRAAVEPTRSISASHRGVMAPTADERQAGPKRAPQPRIRDEDRIPTAQERNASHRAALEQLTGTGAAVATGAAIAAVPRSDSKKLQKKNPPDTYQAPQPTKNNDFIANNQRASGRAGEELAIPGQSRAGVAQSDLRTPPPVALGAGLQQSPGIRSIDSPVAGDTPRQRKRKSSVSFKEPFDRRRPVDEWKQAETARLTSTDFIAEPVQELDRESAWWEQDAKSRKRRSNRSKSAHVPGASAIDDRTAEFQPPLYLRCGPLLRYTGLKRGTANPEKESPEFWRGTVMIVTQDSQSSYEETPTLRLFAQPKQLLPPPPHLVGDDELAPEYVDPIAGLTKLSRSGTALYIRPIEDLEEGKDLSLIETDDGLFERSPRPMDGANDNHISMATVNNRTSSDDGEKSGRFKEIKGVRLHADPENDVTFWLFKLEIELGSEQQHIAYRINRGASTGFWVPARGQTMNIMFHSCNGFSLSVNANDFSGPDPLWRDVLNTHQTRPFHVMLGGGDQIYNDRAITETQHFAAWTQNRNPHYKHHAPFTSEMRQELENFYLNRYCMWFSQGLFSVANSQIPQVNIWDDHDIIDGFGSYPDAFMRSPVFSGIGNVAFKYYMLFQHHSVEAMTTADEPSWLLGYKPGPYIKQLSRSVFLELGRSVAFLGLDCRTERTREDVLNVDTCDLALERCRKEIIEGQTRHLIVLLGVPIAYPRLNWLENVLTSRAMDPLKAMGRYGMLKGGFLNKFDGGVEILDDLDDHWTASHHKSERNWFIKELQDLAAERSVRITILGGDVHLAAIGQFYSNPKLRIPKDLDHRYMPNIVSSAIVNTPPPEMMADIINKRNKVHHLNEYTDESMIPMFTHDVDMKQRNNKHLLPRRNWCSITEYAPGKTPPSSRSTSPSFSEASIPDEEEEPQAPKRRFSLSREDVNPRMLFRRLSSRNAPPTSYRDTMEPSSAKPLRSASYDGTTGDRSPWQRPEQPMQRAASETREPSSDRRDSTDATNPRSRPPLRPGFHRRPTNLSKKAAKKGNVLAVDADGNEFDVNDHVNLEGGLDVVINCEVNQKNPAGITTPYRLLIPALWYDGTSDIEKLPAADGLHRRPTLLQKFGFGGRQGHKAASSQGAGNWGKESETESYTESEEEGRQQQPRKKFGFLGSFRKRRDKDEYFSDEEANAPENSGISTQPTTNAPAGQPRSNVLHDTAPQATHTSNAGFNKPPKAMQQSRGIDSSSPELSAIPPINGRTTRNPASAKPSATRSQQDNSYHAGRSVDRQDSRPKSYVIGSHPGSTSQRSSSAQQPTTHDRGIYDEDSAYIQQQQQRSASSQNPSLPYSTSNAPPPPVTNNQPRKLSKQDRVLGISNTQEAYQANPQQRILRGNGILGKNYSPTSPSAYPNERGYDGIDAYKEKPRRRWSLRDKARGLMDRVEGRRRYDDDNDDEGSEFYSDEEGDDQGQGQSQGQGQGQGQGAARFEHGGGRMVSQPQQAGHGQQPPYGPTQYYPPTQARQVY